MILVLFGQGEVRKREELSSWRQKFSEKITLDLKDQQLSDLVLELRSPSLFNTGDRLVVVENASDNLNLEQLPELDNQTTLLLVAPNLKAEGALLKSAKKLGVKVAEFKPEKETSVFPFIDHLLEGQKVALVELDKLLQEYGAIYILTMIFYGLRRNILPQTSSFVKSKVEAQKKGRDESDWQRLYKETLETEFKIKTGAISEELGLVRLVHSFWQKH